MSDQGESEVLRLLREAFDADVLLGRRPFGRRLWLVPRVHADEQTPKAAERPTLVLIRGGKED